MDDNKAKAMAGQVIDAVHGYLKRNLAPMFERFKAVDERIHGIEQAVAALPKEAIKGDKGDDAPPVDVPAVIAAVLEQIPPARDGLDGKSVDPETVRQLVAEAVAQIPAPRDGKDADPEFVRALVVDAVAALPAPKDGANGLNGKDYDPDVLRAAVAEAVAQIPKPADGLAGKDADPELIRAEVQKAVESIPLPKDGRDGENGKDGASVDPQAVQTIIREQVTAAVKEIPKPADGRDGREGEPGRDAAQIEVLDGIDPAKKYQRGTFASHRGGMVRAFRATDPLPEGAELEKSGWHVVLNGIDEEAIEASDDLRTIAFARRYTDGRLVEKTVSVPTMIYRGIWRDTAAYSRGDTATRGGSTWALMTEKQAGPPGDEGSGWQLSTKKGADGRDGNRGEAGARGAEGRAGKDLTQMGPNGGRW